MKIEFNTIIAQLSLYGSGLKILCVDDDSDFLEELNRVLKNFFAYTVMAKNASDALEYYKNEDFDLIISDITMPKISGVEMIQIIKEQNPLQPIMVISAFGNEQDLIKFINTGVTKFTQKPIVVESFLRSLHEVVKAIYNAKQVEILTTQLQQKLICNTSLLEQYKSAMDISALVSKTDINGKITYVNDRFCKISGYTENELIGGSHNIVRSPRTPKEIFSILWQTIISKKVWHGTLENRTKNSFYYTVESTIIPIVDIENNIIEYIAIQQDISELKKLQTEKLKDSITKALEIHWKSVIECMPFATVIIDINSNILSSNRIFREKIKSSCKNNEPLDSYFLRAEGYLSSDPVLDWKYSLMLNNEQLSKVLFDTQSPPFYVYISVLEMDTIFMVCFIPIEQ